MIPVAYKKLRNFLLATVLPLAAIGQNPPSRMVGKMVWQGRVVNYEMVDGRIVVDGDLIVDTAERLAEGPGEHPDSDLTPGFPPSLADRHSSLRHRPCYPEFSAHN